MIKKYCILFEVNEGMFRKKWNWHFMTLYGHKASSVYKEAINSLGNGKYDFRVDPKDIFIQYKK